MKRISVYALALVAATQLIACTASAQEKREKKEKKEQIIIRKSGDKSEKTTIVIEGDKVTINGKPVEKGDRNVIIERFDGDSAIMFRSPRIRVTAPRMYRNGPGGWNEFRSEDFMKEFELQWKSGPLLGVITEENEKGALIEEVQNETAAAKAGLQKGDIITKVGDMKITSPNSLSEAIRSKKPNDEVEITYLREGKEKKVKAKLGETKGPGGMGMHNFNFHIPEIRTFNGGDFNFEHLQPRLHGLQNELFLYPSRPKFGATIQDTEEGNGAKVLEIEADSPSAKSGLQKDDIITEVDGKTIKNVADARAALRGKNEQNLWTVKVLRGGKPVTIEVKIPKKLNKADL